MRGVATIRREPRYCRCIDAWRELPHAARSRVHLACVPMADPDEAAAIVNALAAPRPIVVQKSLAEGFGLTVAEAMWKSRPVVASAVGGIVDQIVDREYGVLIDDPTDLAEFAAASAPPWRPGGSAAARRQRRARVTERSSATATSSSTGGSSNTFL